MHHSSSHSLIYSILVSLSLCITLLHTADYILYWHLYQCVSLFFKPQIYSILVSLSLCITLLHTTTQYILYWHLYHCASLFFTQLNIFYTGIFVIMYHSSSHSRLYSILAFVSVCITLLHTPNIFYTGIFIIVHNSSSHHKYILYWYLYHCASHFFTP